MKRLWIVGLFFALLLLAGAVWAPCAARPSLAYHWPIKPFDRQHPIRGGFGDPRTLDLEQPFGVTRPDDSGAYSFHGGIDIVGRAGTPVYPVVSGRVILAGNHKIVVDSGDSRVFEYWHLRSNVELGQEVVAEHTVIGWIQRPLLHVHLSETDDNHAQNPLAPGHLEPYADHTKPRAIALDFDNGRSPELTQGGRLPHGDALAIDAVDQPAMPVPGEYAGLPQTPALVDWRLRSGRRHWSAWHITGDFRRTVPGPLRFWNVYAPGTYQNSPGFAGRPCFGVAGLYLFRVGLDTSRLRAGDYKLEAKVSDIRGNTSRTIWPLEIPG